MAAERKGSKRNVKAGARVYFVYPRRDAALLDKAIKASGLSQSAYFVEAGKLRARVQAEHERAQILEAARIMATSQ